MMEIDQYKQEKAARQEAAREQIAAAKAEQEAQDYQLYIDWYNKLSYEDKMKETRWQEEQKKAAQAREDMLRLNYLAIMNSNMNQAMDRIHRSFQPRQTPSFSPPVTDQAPLYIPQRQRCTSNVFGDQIMTNCY
jgi:hypothetical protein